MRVLVTGGMGFIGSALVDALLRFGHEVDIVDNLVTGKRSNLDLNCPKVNLFKTRVEDWKPYEPYDVIFHLAAALGVQNVVDNPIETIQTNIRSTEKILEYAYQTKTPTFIASTSEVYGKNTDVPYTEQHDLVMGPTSVSRWNYACSKMIDEFLGLGYAEKGLPIIIGRFFNTVGPKQTVESGMVIPRFVHNALTGLPITIYGDGQQTRCFCYVADTVSAIIRLMVTPRAYGQVFNIGSTEEVSMLNLAERILRKVKVSKPIIEFKDYQSAHGKPFEDMIRRVPSIEKITSLTGWKPQTNLDTTLDIIIDHAHRNLQITNPQ